MKLTMFTLLLAALLTVGCAFGSPMANQYIDSVLHTSLRNQVRSLNLDPAILNDFSTTFKDKVMFVTVKGTANYTGGTLQGLSNARRWSECYGPYFSYGARSINCTIVFDRLNIHYSGKLKYGKVPTLNINAVSNITTSLVFIEVSQAGNAQPHVKNFLYQSTGHQQVKHTGLGGLNKYMKILDDGFKAHIQANIFNAMSQRFQYALNQAVAYVPLPN